MLLIWLSSRKKSYIPRTSGSSGPTTTMLMLFDSTNCLTEPKLVGLISTFVPQRAVPALPGAMNRRARRLLCAIFHAKACSRPPEPSKRTLADSGSLIVILYPLNSYRLSRSEPTPRTPSRRPLPRRPNADVGRTRLKIRKNSVAKISRFVRTFADSIEKSKQNMDIGGSRPAKGFPAWLPNEETAPAT